MDYHIKIPVLHEVSMTRGSWDFGWGYWKDHYSVLENKYSIVKAVQNESTTIGIVFPVQELPVSSYILFTS